MEGPAYGGVMRHFVDLPDPRASNVRHRLIDLLFIALCATICGADGWEDFQVFARSKRSWFSQFLDLRHGVPSADTFRRVFSRLDPDAFERCFLAWMQAVSEQSQGKLLAIDGKSLRRSFDHAWDKIGMTHMVSAFVAHNGQVFSQVKAQGKGMELEAITQLLGMIDLSGAVVTIDAIGAQKKVARQIVQGGGDYVLALKKNQRGLHRSVQVELDDMIRDDFKDVEHDHHEMIDGDHGRIEIRRVWVTEDLNWLKQARAWPGLRSVAVVEANREVHGDPAGPTVQRRYYISSLPADAKLHAQAIRSHWGVENQLHHVLDISFREDDSRIRRGHGAENVSRLRRISLNLIKTHGKTQHPGVSIKGLRKACGWDDQTLLKTITG